MWVRRLFDRCLVLSHLLADDQVIGQLSAQSDPPGGKVGSYQYICLLCLFEVECLILQAHVT